MDVVDPNGVVVRMTHAVHSPVVGATVSFTTTYTSSLWAEPQVSHSTLRFVDAASLARLLADAGLVVEQQFGDWDRQPLTESSPEIITITRRA